MDTVAVDMECVVAGAEAMMTIADRYHNDSEFREAVDAKPTATLAANGVELPPGREARVICNTVDTFHVVMPEEPNLSLDDEDLEAVTGGINISSINFNLSELFSLAFNQAVALGIRL